MGRFIYDIQLGFLAFPLVALLLALPYALYQYRRFGAISAWKTFVVFTFILYCLCTVSLVVFPLPADHTAVVEAASKPQLHPFNFIDGIRATTDFSLNDRSTWGPSLKSPVMYEAIFNVMLTIPLGAYLCYLFRCRWWMALIIGFATTLLFETSQLTGLFGIYSHPYRLFDVDDLILNMTGTMIGFWLMIPVSWALPSMTEVNERATEKGLSRVSVTRRALALLVDALVLAACFAIAWIMLSPTNAQIAKALAIDPSRAGAETLAFRFIGGLVADPVTAILIGFAIAAVLFAVIPMLTKGRTIGKALVGLRIVDANGHDAPLSSYWSRFGAITLFCLLPLVAVMLAPEDIEGMSSNTIFQMVGLIAIVWAITVVGRAIGSFSGHPYVSLSDVVSSTRVVPAKQTAAEAPSQPVQGDGSPAGDTALYPATATATAAERPNPSRDFRKQRQEPVRQAAPNTPADADDYGKQAALDSLLGMNYDEQHPTFGESSDNAPTTAIPVVATTEAATQTISDIGEGTATELITDPEIHRRIRRDQRPDAGGTQAFKKQ